MKSFISMKQRITAVVTATFMLLQIFLPAAAAAATLLSNESVSKAMLQPQFQLSGNNSYLYEQANYDDSQFISNKNITSFHDELVATKINVGNPSFVPIAGDITIFIPTYPVGKLIGDNYVQSRYIRQQITNILGRHMIDAAQDMDEIAQINRLYANAKTFAITKNNIYKYGDNLPAAEVITLDMIWPESRTINGVQVMVPVVYLRPETISAFAVNDHKIEFLGGTATFKTISLDHAKLVSGVNTVISTKGDLLSLNSTISSAGNLNLVVGGTLLNLSSTINAQKNIDILAGQFNSKTLLQPFTDRYGSGTRLGRVSKVDTATGNLSIATLSDIQFEGSTAVASNGSITLNAGNNISILPVTLNYSGKSTDSAWRISNSSVDIVGSKLTAKDTISLYAEGAITISASELISTQGGIELLAQQGIYVLDEQGNTQVSREKYKGRTQGTSSDFNTWAVRSVLNAGKGVLMDTDAGDITLRAAQISSVDGTSVYARNGKVHLLITKEQSQHYLNMVRKGTWTIKTKSEQDVVETPIPNSIVGGFAVEALQGVDVEYAGKKGSTLAQQIAEYEKMPDMKWMATLYNNGQVNGNVDWNQVELVYKHIHESNTSLSPAAMAIIAIAVCVAMGPAGAGWIGSGGNAIGAATFNGMTVINAAAMQAGALTLATSAAQNLAAGKSIEQTLKTMSSDDSLKSLAISMATAGAMPSMQMDSLTKAADSANLAISLSAQSAQAVINSTVTAGISVSIDGGNTDDFKKAFKTSLATNAINAIGQNITNKITNSTTLNEASKYIANAAMGCLTAGLTNKLNDQDFKDACPSAAGGAVISQLIVDKLQADIKDSVAQANADPSSTNVKNVVAKLNSYQNSGVDLPKLIAALTAFALGGDVNAAANSATTVAQSNVAKFADIAGMYLSFTGGSACLPDKFAACSTAKAESELAALLHSQGLSEAEVQQNLVLLHDFNIKLGLVNALAYDNGSYLDVLAEKHQASGSVSYSGNNVDEVISIGVKLNALQTAVLDLENAGGQLLKDNPGKKMVLESAIMVASFGWAKTALTYAGMATLSVVAPDVAKDKLKDVFESISSTVGNGSVSFVQGSSFQDVSDDIQSGDIYTANASSFSSWFVGQVIVGAPAITAAVKNVEVAAARVGAAFKISVLETRTATQVNAEMKAAGDLPAWLEGTNVIIGTVPQGTRYEMVIDAKQAEAFFRAQGWFGWFATPEKVISQAFARDKLVILQRFKEDVSFVITVETTAIQSIKYGWTGPLEGFLGGVKQVQFFGAKNLKIVGNPRPLPLE